MIEMWLVYRTLKKYFDMVVKPNDCELSIAKKEDFHSFAEYKPRDRKVTHWKESCSTSQHTHERIKEFKLLKSQNLFIDLGHFIIIEKSISILFDAG